MNILSKLTSNGTKGLNPDILNRIKVLENLLSLLKPNETIPRLQNEYDKLIKTVSDLSDRPFWFEVENDLVQSLPSIKNKRNLVEEFKKPYDLGEDAKIIKEASFTRLDLQMQLQEMLSKEHGYNLDFSDYPRTHYEYKTTTREFEKPIAGPKELPVIIEGSGVNDLMYAQAHIMWNLLSPEMKKKLTPIYEKIWKNPPTDPKGLYTPASRAFSVSKDIQASLYEKFMNDNRFTVKNYEEWCEYVDDLMDDDLRYFARKVHGGNSAKDGYWFEHNNLDMSDEGIEALRETLKYLNGGKLICKRSISVIGK